MAKIPKYSDGEPVISMPTGDILDIQAERMIRPVRDYSPAKVEQLPVNWRDQLGELIPPSEHASHSQGSSQEDGDGALYGRNVAVTVPSNAPAVTTLQRQNAIWVPRKKKAGVWTVTVAVDKVPLRTDNNLPDGQLVAYIQYMLGGIVFTKKVFIVSTVPRRIPIQGRQIQIDCGWENLSPAFLSAGQTTVNFSVACEEGYLPNIEYYSPEWIRNPTVANPIADKYIVLANSAGMLMAAFGYLTAFGGADARYYPMFFDSATGPPVGGAPPIMVGVPLTAVNQSFSFDDEFSPQTAFNTGLSVALSTTDVIYTAAAAGAQWRCDCKVGT